jgi:hypothetical protein
MHNNLDTICHFIYSIHVKVRKLNRESRENREWSRRCNPGFSLNSVKTLLASIATVSIDRYGKVAKRAGEPEDLPWHIAVCLRASEQLTAIKGLRKLGATLQAFFGLKGFFLG